MSKIRKRAWFFIISALISAISVGFVIWRVNFGVISAHHMTSMAVDLMGILLMTIEIGGCIPDKAYDERTVDKFTHFLMIMAFTWFVDMVTWGVDCINLNVAVIIAWIFESLYYLCNITSIGAFFIYISDVVHVSKKKLRIYTWCLISVMLLYVVLLIVNIWTRIMFGINNGVYYRGVLATPTYILGVVLLLILLLIIRKAETSKAERIATYAYIILPIGFTVIQMLSYGFAFIPLATVVSTGIIYVHMYLHQSKVMGEQKIELQKNQTAVMLSQIQPHFLFNCLSTIVALCDLDPKLAKQTTLDFSTYLERNLNAVTEMELIPFEKELEQVIAYLNIEKARFGDYLRVEYDLKVLNFQVPSLTVQPMVENAVKHGIQARAEGGTLMISTFETIDSWVVEIKDNGYGIDTEGSDVAGYGIGISNTRKRLSVMCSGTLTISGEKDTGTTVTIRIPKER